MNNNEIRLKAAEEYYSRVKKAMEGGCIEGYIFGSVARNEANPSSDLDIMLVLKRPTKQERFDWNTQEEVMKRNMVINFAKNSHQIYLIQDELEKKYGFDISVYTHYHDAGLEDIVPLCQDGFVPFRKVIAEAISLD
jgi:predicted nucleotidyltransferase